MKQRVFISYARDDQPAVQRLIEHLHEMGISGWLDTADIAAGTAIADAMREAIRGSSAVIVIISPSALINRWIHFEVGAAQAMGKRLIPVLIEGEGIEQELPAFLSDFNFLDARGKPLAQVAQQIKKAIRLRNSVA